MSGSAANGRANNLGTGFLAIASGGADVIAFLTLGHVFASAMTGNTALLGIALSQGDLSAASLPVSALLGFALGALAASVAYDPNASPTRKQLVLRSLIGLEIACLAGFALLWQIVGHPPQGPALYGLILLCSFAMGVQGIAAKIINAPGVNTIVFTSTLVAIVFSLTELALGRRDTPAIRAATKRQIYVFAAYATGAVFAGLLDWAAFGLLAWVPMTAAILALICLEAANMARRER
ncbi:MAG: YoaK family protein [Pseudomonadota bacterium]